MLSAKDVRHIAKLAKIKINPPQEEQFAKQLTKILDYFAKLQTVDTEKIPETTQTTGLTNVWRPDDIKIEGHEKAMLECSDFPKENHSLRIPKIM